MVSPSRPSSTTLPQPDNAEAIRRSFEGYRAALARMKPAELRGELTRINAAIEEQRASMVRQVIAEPLSDYISKIDQVVLRSPRPESQSSSSRGRASQGSPSSPQQGPLDLLFGSSRGRRLAAKLVAANSRSVAGVRRKR